MNTGSSDKVLEAKETGPLAHQFSSRKEGLPPLHAEGEKQAVKVNPENERTCTSPESTELLD